MHCVNVMLTYSERIAFAIVHTCYSTLGLGLGLVKIGAIVDITHSTADCRRLKFIREVREFVIVIRPNTYCTRSITITKG